MKDFIRVFILLVIVLASVAVLYYLGFVLGYWGWAIFEIVLSVGLILLAIRLLPSHRPPRSR
ncbi:hypothetical protein AB9P05_17370 [Roseivirga sp. BDSF3-8]|uniref:hypothetical protein n=1 Tax=Roseivirga sp. BDSF3-8 TaxID=3241598 RepID=UPI00353249A8